MHRAGVGGGSGAGCAPELLGDRFAAEASAHCNGLNTKSISNIARSKVENRPDEGDVGVKSHDRMTL